VGVAAIALGTLDKYDVNVPIVPVGLTYFRGHRFRGRLVVEFGEPIYISDEISAKYGESKKEAYAALLQQVEKGMRSVIVTAHDYNDLKLVHTVRRLHQRSSTSTTTKQKQDLARRWSEAYKMLKERYKEEGLPEDIAALLAKVKDYQDALDRWGLRDYQLQHTHLQLSYSKMLYIFLHGLVILTLASLPSLILNFPVGMAANYWAYREAKKDLQASRVKLAARDVLLSKKILFSMAAVPILWVSYALLALLFTSLERRTILVLFLCCPLFSYIGVMAMEASIVDLKDLWPAFLRLLPGFQQSCEALPAQRAAIQRELRGLVEKYGPSFGPLYTDRTDAWEAAHFGLAPTEERAVGAAHVAPPTNHDQIASSIATTFCDEDEAALAKLENKKQN
jgi:glycerol-3-phosphate O-acyltransferase/dihydroxyacetone phosphate acyltransferase